MPFFYYGFDPTYILILIGLVITVIAQSNVSVRMKKYSKVRSKCGKTGYEVAREILDKEGLFYVKINSIGSNLTDYYDPRRQMINLSNSTYHSTSITAVSVAAHECGHAIQHKEEYAPLKIRSAIVPAANFGSRFGLPIVVLGIILSSNNFLIATGIIVFSLAVLFQIITLPVEFDASRRALVILEDGKFLAEDEVRGSKKVLSAAAMTYIAAAAASILSLLRLILLSRRSSD